MSGTIQSCGFCPQLCRHLCPVAVATGREAATPPKIMAALMLADRGRIPPDDAAVAATLCTDCGACERHCKYSVPVPALLAQARQRYPLPVTAAALAEIEGDGELVALHCDERSWGPSLAEALAAPVAVLSTSDHLGRALLDHPADAAPHLARLQAACRGRRVVTTCSRCAAVLEAAKVSWLRIETLLPLEWRGPVHACREDGLGTGTPLEHAPTCCGAHGPLPVHHPELAADVARDAARLLPDETVATGDSTCRTALRRAGADVRDPIDLILGLQPDPERT